LIHFVRQNTDQIFHKPDFIKWNAIRKRKRGKKQEGLNLVEIWNQSRPIIKARPNKKLH